MTDLFNDDQDTGLDPEKNYLEELVGEGKKFKSPEDLAKGKAESDAFIERLQSELRGLRQELSTRLRLEEVVEKISTSASTQSPSSDDTTDREPDGKPDTAITPESVQELVEKTISETEAKSRRVRNLELVESKLQEAFGPTFRRTVKDQAAKLGLGEKFLSDLAAEQPIAFLKLMDVDGARKEVNPAAITAPRSQVNSDAITRPRNDGVKRKSHYDAIKRSDPKRYWSVAVQQEMHREAVKQGESFFDA